MKRITALLAMCMALFVFSAQAADTIIEGFETGNTGNITDAGSPTPQTHNKSVTNTFAVGTSNPTEGAQSLSITMNWNQGVAAIDAASNPHVASGPLKFWSFRANTSGAAYVTIPNPSILRADFFNNSTSPIQVCLYVQDGAGQLERGPFKTLAANSATTYEWNMNTEPATGWVTGNGTLTGSLILRSFVFYTETEPLTATMVVDVDNIRIVDAQSDLTAPAAPKLLSVAQGPNPGDLVVTWAANSEVDMDKYNVYLMADSAFGAAITNRFDFPAVPAGSANHPATSLTLTGVTTEEPVYIRLTAVDNATPIANESLSAVCLGARLKADGSEPSDLVVLDLDRYAPTEAMFNQNGYAHMIVYNARALDSYGRYFNSCLSDAVDSAAVSLPVGADNVVVWSNGWDGNAVVDETLTELSIAAIEGLLDGGGNLMISGLALGADLTAPNGSAVDQAFFANYLKATLVNDNAAATNITTGGPFSVSDIATSTDVFNVAAGATTDIEAIGSAGALTAMTYTPAIPGGFGAAYDANKMVYLAFPFEMVRDPATPAGFNAAQTKRAELMATILDYLVGAPPLAAGSSWNLYE